MSLCAVDSMNISDCLGQHPPHSPVPRRFPHLLQVHPCSYQYLLHPPSPRPSSLFPLLANIISFPRPSALITCPKTPSSVLRLSVTMTNLSFPLSPYRLIRSLFCLCHPKHRVFVSPPYSELQ